MTGLTNYISTETDLNRNNFFYGSKCGELNISFSLLATLLFKGEGKCDFDFVNRWVIVYLRDVF